MLLFLPLAAAPHSQNKPLIGPLWNLEVLLQRWQLRLEPWQLWSLVVYLPETPPPQREILIHRFQVLVNSIYQSIWRITSFWTVFAEKQNNVRSCWPGALVNLCKCMYEVEENKQACHFLQLTLAFITTFTIFIFLAGALFWSDSHPSHYKPQTEHNIISYLLIYLDFSWSSSGTSLQGTPAVLHWRIEPATFGLKASQLQCSARHDNGSGFSSWRDHSNHWTHPHIPLLCSHCNRLCTRCIVMLTVLVSGSVQTHV